MTARSPSKIENPLLPFIKGVNLTQPQNALFYHSWKRILLHNRHSSFGIDCQTTQTTMTQCFTGEEYKASVIILMCAEQCGTRREPIECVAGYLISSLQQVLTTSRTLTRPIQFHSSLLLVSMNPSCACRLNFFIKWLFNPKLIMKRTMLNTIHPLVYTDMFVMYKYHS